MAKLNVKKKKVSDGKWFNKSLARRLNLFSFHDSKS